MIVTCPACSTSYLVDPRTLGSAGRLVRCAKCANTWHQAPPADAAPRGEAPTAEERPLRASERSQRPAPPQRRPRRWGAVLGWIFLIAIVAGFVAAAYLERDEVVALWPPAARLYIMIGLPVIEPGTGLHPRNVTLTREKDGDSGLPTLIIQGEVVNESPVTQTVPKLKVVLRDGSNHDVQSWTFTATEERLLPGASVPFRTSLAQPSEAATQVVVTFAGNGN